MDITIMLSKKLNIQYEKELLKQTDKYSYYLCENDSKINDKKGEIKGVKDKDPFICIEINNTHKLYDANKYFIYESISGHSSDEERCFLIDEAEKLNSDLIYSDIDYENENGIRHTPFFKPDWSPDTFDSIDYISDFFAIKKELIHEDIKIFDKISHVTKPLFHCISNNNDIDIYNEFTNGYLYPDYENERDESDEVVSVIIPSKDNPKLLSQCLESLRRAKINSGINTIETIVVDNGSNDDNKEKIANVIENNPELNITYIYEPADFNFSKMCNRGVEESTGKYLLFLNDDIEVLDDFFLVKLLHYARKNHVGAVAPKLYYPESDIIQHVGITDLLKCGPSHKLSTHSDSETYYFGYNRINRNTLAVTGACLMVSREKYFLINGFHDKMKVGYNDVDLCISLYEKGYFNVLVNDAVLYHHESISRGSDIVSDAKFFRLKEERNLLYERHPFLRDKGDPFYNVNLIDDSLDYTVNVTPLCDDRTYRSECQTNIKRVHSSKHAHFNVETITYERGLFDEGDALVITGWALLNKKNNINYDRYLFIRRKADEAISGSVEKNDMLLFSVADKYREDVTKVFPEAKNALISGFVSKIPVKIFEEKLGAINIERINEEFECGIIFSSKITGMKYYAGK